MLVIVNNADVGQSDALRSVSAQILDWHAHTLLLFAYGWQQSRRCLSLSQQLSIRPTTAPHNLLLHREYNSGQLCRLAVHVVM